jgi:zinc transporter ZupT
MRLWNAILWTTPYFIFGMMIYKNNDDSERKILLLSMWTLLFLHQGPIYPMLVLCAILVAGSRNKPFIVSVVLVGLSGYYAQLSRYTWAFAPAMWVGMWTLGRAYLEKRSISKKIWARAITFVIAGLVGGVILPLVLKTNQILTVEGISASITNHPLIWSRLWPNPTFAPGIILGLVIAITPILIILGHLLITKSWRLNFWQTLAIGAGLLAFLVVGLIVSIKIGGGGNLHNLDMFLIGLLFVAAVAWERGGLEWIQSQEIPPWIGYIFLLAVLQPIVLPLVSSQPLRLPNKELTQSSLKTISNKVSEAAGKGEVLFIDQRQLITFGYVDQIPLVDDYEKKIVTNEAMEGDKTYFEGFYRDLADHRFSLIVTQPLKTRSVSDREQVFGLEHNAWLEWVDEPLLCYYQKEVLFIAVKTVLLVPREEPCENVDQYE